MIHPINILNSQYHTKNIYFRIFIFDSSTEILVEYSANSLEIELYPPLTSQSLIKIDVSDKDYVYRFISEPLDNIIIESARWIKN